VSFSGASVRFSFKTLPREAMQQGAELAALFPFLPNRSGQDTCLSQLSLDEHQRHVVEGL
jgi:hypothetical protein